MKCAACGYEGEPLNAKVFTANAISHVKVYNVNEKGWERYDTCPLSVCPDCGTVKVEGFNRKEGEK